MTEDEARDVLHRYRTSPAYPVPGQPFGWGIVELKHRIKQRLIKRGMSATNAFFHTERMYERIMRYKPSYSQYCKAVRMVERPIMRSLSDTFTNDELRHLIDLFTGANDPLSKNIAIKAKNMLDHRNDHG